MHVFGGYLEERRGWGKINSVVAYIQKDWNW